jgi:hypothetical protein
MKSGQRAYEDRRAQKAGKTLEQWTREKYFHDPLSGQIAAFIEACEAFDARLPGLPMLIMADPDSEAAELPYHASDGENAAEITPVATEPAGAIADNTALGVDEETRSSETQPPGDIQSESLAIVATEDRVPDDDEDSFDETWMAMDSLDRWSRERDIVREAILRTLSGE